jgi:hypothetical protein
VTYFTDRNLGHLLPVAMGLLGIPIEIHDTHYTQFTPDDVWLPEVGANGWIVLTQDPRFLHNENEKEALVSNGVGCFVLVTDGLKKWEKLRVIAKVWDEVEKIVADTTPPYIYRITKAGDVKCLYPPEAQTDESDGESPLD